MEPDKPPFIIIEQESPKIPRRGWAEMIRKMSEVDFLTCPKCQVIPRCPGFFCKLEYSRQASNYAKRKRPIKDETTIEDVSLEEHYLEAKKEGAAVDSETLNVESEIDYTWTIE